MYRITFGERIIASAGYDALRKELEVEFTKTGKVCLFCDVDEDAWYGLKFSDCPDKYFRKCISGRYLEQRT